VESIDTRFETDAVFDVVTDARRIELVERRLPAPLVKGYSTREVLAPWASWQRGWVAEGGELRGFACVEHEPWHQRLTLWFLYIAPSHRRAGVGRALLAQAEAFGREVAASHVWLETSNVNVPGVRAYERLGYALCGADTRYYGTYMPGETALYLAKPL
jgi:ribosomal protein S18 acetylase RimI-like enzyme